MSGAEALVAVGVASNFIQLIQFTASLCSRIKEYAAGVELPRKLAAQADRLSDLLAVLQSLATSLGHDPLGHSVLTRCLAQARLLSDLLDGLKEPSQGPLKNARKALKSLNQSNQIEEFENVLDSLVNTLSLQLQAEARSTTKQTEANTISMLERQMEQTSILNDLQHTATLQNQASKETEHVSTLLWMVPIGRNPAFVGRKAILSALESKLSPMADSVSTAVLCGLGGVGKSQIALEYAYRLKDKVPEISVFWIHAGNAARFVESYKRIASHCNIPGKDDPMLDVLQLVRDWLEMKYNCKWLMIIDNVDDRSFFEGLTSTGKTLREYVPQSRNGTIIYTTRNRDIGIDLSLERDPIFVPSMEVEEARDLLGKQIRAESTKAEQLELLDALVYLALAISQAVAYMVKRNKSVTEYMRLYRKSESARISLLGQKFGSHGREARPLESVVTTWWISFNHIKSENPRAAELLSMMSFMDYQNVPIALLIRDDEETFDFEEAMGLLEAFSLVHLDTKRSSCNVHRLVTVAVQCWLREFEDERGTLAGQALKAVADQFPYGVFESWPTCRLYLPHAEAVLRSPFLESNNFVLHARATLLLNMSSYFRMQGQYEASQRGAEESMQLFERLYGREHEDTLSSIANYAYSLQRRGHYQRAVDLQREVLCAREKLLGYGHRATLESLNALGSDLQILGLYKEAEEIHLRELEEKQKLLERNPGDRGLEADAIIALENVARVLSSQGRYAEAEVLQRQALERSIIVNGYYHPNTFIGRGELAGTVRDQERFAEAETMYEQLLEDRRKILGERHHDTLIALGNMATVKARLGKKQESEKLYREALKIELETLGEHHPSTVNTLHNLACCSSDKGDHKEAESGFRRCLNSQNATIGPNHPDTIRTRHNLSANLRELQKLEEAEWLARETLDLCDSMQENREIERVEALDHLARIIADQKRFEEAEHIRREELEMRLEIQGESHPDTVLCRSHLAFVLVHQGKNEEAALIQSDILAYRYTIHGREHEETLDTLWNLALCYRDLEQFELAETKYKELVDIHSEVHGPESDAALESLLQLSWVLQQQKKYAASEENYRKVLKARIVGPGPEDLLTLMVMNNLSSVLKYQDNCCEETTILQRHVYATRSRLLGPTHELSMKSLKFLADHLQDQGKNDEADALYEKYNDLLETTAGPKAKLAEATTM